MNTVNNISFKKAMTLPGFIILVFIFIAILGVIMDSQSLAAEVDIKNIYLAPFENSNYILGTDSLGRSVAFGLMNGIKLSLYIATLTGLVSLLIGLFFAYLGGYLGNDKLFLSPISIVGLILIVALGLFYFWNSPSLWVLLIASILIYLLIIFDKKILKNSIKKSLPLDWLIMKYVTLQKSLPGIFLILFVFALFSDRSVFNIIVLITFSRIPALIRLSRSEVLKVKNQEFVIAAEAMGLNSFQVFRKHIIPNILTPLKTYLIYTMATTILIESTLSFLGLGLSLETVTLGSMLSSSRDFFSAWWLAILPGGIIFLLIYSIRKLFAQSLDSENYSYL